MRILAFDTTNQVMTVVLTDNGTFVASAQLNRKKSHSTALLTTIQGLLAQSGWAIESLERIVVAQGPGSYTGVRIAVTTAKTLADTLKIELVGVSSLAVLAASVTRTNALIVPLIDARRGTVFTGAYQWRDGHLLNVIADKHSDLRQFARAVAVLQQPTVWIGENAETFAEPIIQEVGPETTILSGVDALPNPVELAQLGMHEAPVPIATFVPRYLRMTEAETNWLKTHNNQGHAPYVQKV